MVSDHTQQQSTEQQREASERSQRRSRPPTEVPGYELQQFLGSGAYGEVWVGVNRTTRRKVAVKFYLHRGGLDWSLLDRETEKLVFLAADRYVVQLLDVGWTADPPYYVMEFIENGSLDDYLRKHGRLGVEQAVELFRELATGLSHAHGKGVLHCDLKPANVLLDADHKPRLADFGQSRLSHEQTPALGTLFYMAPEQADLAAVPDVQWDVYALGAILHTLLTGGPPHRTDQVLGQIESAAGLPDRLARYRELIRTAPDPTADPRLPRLDRALVDILSRCLAADPARRFATVPEVLDALRARSASRYRRPLMMLGVVGPLLLLLIMGLFSWRGYVEARQQSTDAIRRRAYEANKFAATFIARTLEREIQRYFEIVEREARAESLWTSFAPAAASDELAGLADLATSDADRQSMRQRFLQEAARTRLLDYLDGRLQEHLRRSSVDHLAPKFASMFVTDARGTILAAVYDPPDHESKSEGRNFAWRTYYHGGPADLARDTPPATIQPIEGAHLSAAFKSTTTNTWKVAVSTPFRSPGPGGEFAGVLVFTVNVGDFEFLQDRGGESDRFAVLVDDRPGSDRGTILQHPLYTEPRAVDRAGDPNAPPEELSLGHNRVMPEQLQAIAADGNYSYQDPLGQTPQGRSYAGDWIAAWEGVRLGNGAAGNGSRPATDLVVIVQERELAATGPVRDLGNRLVREALFALVGMICTVVVLWYFVLRLWGGATAGSPARPPRAVTPTPLADRTTLSASAMQRPR